MSMMAIWARLQATIGPGPTALLQRLIFQNVVIDPSAVVAMQTAVTFDNVAVTSPITWIPATQGNWLRLTLTSNAAFTLNVTTTGMRLGQIVYLTLRNTIGGAAGVMTLGATFKASDTTPTMPATATSRTYAWIFDGTNLIEWGPQATVDVPN